MEAQRGNRERVSDRIPEFWIRPEDKRGRSLDVRVLDASRHLWPWAYRHVEIELHDGARAAELLEEVAIDVSARLRAEPEVERNLNGYLITAFHHRVRSQLLRDSRLVYEGLLYELEENHQPRAADWAAALETKLALNYLVSYLPHQAKHMLNYWNSCWRDCERVGNILDFESAQTLCRVFGIMESFPDSRNRAA